MTPLIRLWCASAQTELGHGHLANQETADLRISWNNAATSYDKDVRSFLSKTEGMRTGSRNYTT